VGKYEITHAKDGETGSKFSPTIVIGRIHGAGQEPGINVGQRGRRRGWFRAAGATCTAASAVRKSAPLPAAQATISAPPSSRRVCVARAAHWAVDDPLPGKLTSRSPGLGCAVGGGQPVFNRAHVANADRPRRIIGIGGLGQWPVEIRSAALRLRCYGVHVERAASSRGSELGCDARRLQQRFAPSKNSRSSS